MDLETFKAVIEKNGGESRVIAITFDNSSGVTFVDGWKPYTHAEYLDEENSCLRIPSTDVGNRTFYVVKPLDTIQAIHFASLSHSRTDYDKATISY